MTEELRQPSVPVPSPDGPQALSNIERAVFGDVDRRFVDDWLNRQVLARLAVEVRAVLFRTGRLAAVYGLDLDDGRTVAMKIGRPTLDPERELDRVTAAVACQRLLAASAFPCPTPVDQPWTTSGSVAYMEATLSSGRRGNGHDAEIRTALATSLAEQVWILRGVSFPVLRTALPAWLDHRAGPWPTPHDPIFDFTITPPRFAWLDDLAADAARVIRGATGTDVIAHSDWTCGNVLFAGSEVAAAYDWDSLVCHSEPILAGLAGASYTQRSSRGAHSPTPDETASFLSTYDDARSGIFSHQEQIVAAASATWTLAYNARCELCLADLGITQEAGSALSMLIVHGREYLEILW